jgi:Flp pilus assembly protein TadD
MSASATSLVESMASAWNAGDAERVLALAIQAADAEAADKGFLALLGLAQQQTGDYARAVQTFERLTRLQPDVSAWWNNLGVACRHAGDLDASEQALSKAKALAPGDAEVHYNLGLLHVRQRRWSAAREALLEAVRLAPWLVEARLQAAHACHVCGDVEG